VTGVLDRLERAGVLRREADPADRRRVVARLVPEGMERVREVYAGVGSEVEDLYAGYDDAQLAFLVDYTERNAEMTRRITTEMRANDRGTTAETEGRLSAPLGDVTPVASRWSPAWSDADRRRPRDARPVPGQFRAARAADPGERWDGEPRVPRLWHPGTGRGQVTLSGAIPWALDIRGGAADMDLELAALALSEMTMNGGASKVDVQLSRPVGTVPLRIRGGAAG